MSMVEHRNACNQNRLFRIPLLHAKPSWVTSQKNEEKKIVRKIKN